MKRINKKNITENEFNKILSQYNNQLYMKENENEENENKNEEEKYFESLSLCQKLHPSLKMDDLLDCVKLIAEFYEDMCDKNKKDDNNKINSNKSG